MSDPQNEDYSGYLDVSQDDSKLAKLQQLAEQQAAAELDVAAAQRSLDEANAKLKDLQERVIPELMDEVGMAEFRTKSGLMIKIAESLRASIPKQREPEAFAWLREHGNAALVKRELTLKFGKGEDEKANALFLKLSEEYEPEDKTSVHPSTLKAFVAEALANGRDLPLDLFGVFRQRKSVITV